MQLALATAAAALLALASPSGAQAETGLVGAWHLDDAPGAGTSFTTPDSSGNGLDGSLTSAPAVQPGRFGNALRFGAGKAVRIPGDLPASAGLATQSFTVTLWFQRSGTPGQVQYLISKGAPACDHSSYAVFTGFADPADGDNLGLQGYAWDGQHDTYSRKAPESVWDGQWHALAYTYDGGISRLAIDGVDLGTRGIDQTSGADPIIPGGPVAQDNQPLFIGDFPSRGGCQMDAFAGGIDEVRVYSRKLSDAEITRLADRSATTPPTTDPPAAAAPGSASSPAPAPTPSPAPAAVPQPVPASSVLTWGRVKSGGRTLLQSLSIDGALAGDTITLDCTGKSCPKRLRKKTIRLSPKAVKRGRATLTSSVKGALLSPGARFTVIIARPGFVSRVIAYAMVKGRDPRRTARCQAAGDKAPRTC